MGHRRSKQDQKKNENLKKMVMTKKQPKYNRNKQEEKWDLKKD